MPAAQEAPHAALDLRPLHCSAACEVKLQRRQASAAGVGGVGSCPGNPGRSAMMLTALLCTQTARAAALLKPPAL